MSLVKDYKSDTAKELDGVSVERTPNADGTKPTFVLSRMSKTNKRYTKAFEVATRPHRRAISLGTMNESLAESVLMGVFVETVLLGWSNVQNESMGAEGLLFPNYAEGEAVPFNKENAVHLFTTLPELYEDLSAEANNAALFRTAVQEEEAKN